MEQEAFKTKINKREREREAREKNERTGRKSSTISSSLAAP